MSEIKCPKCYGDGIVDCPTCDGRYSVSRGMDNLFGIEHTVCPNCDNEFKITCNKCGGTGTVDEDD